MAGDSGEKNKNDPKSYTRHSGHKKNVEIRI
jgi:hypothetical protein